MGREQHVLLLLAGPLAAAAAEWHVERGGVGNVQAGWLLRSMCGRWERAKEQAAAGYCRGWGKEGGCVSQQLALQPALPACSTAGPLVGPVDASCS